MDEVQATPSLLDNAQPAEQVEATTEATTEAAVDSTWKYSDDIAGAGDAPEWFDKSKYKTISDQAKAHPELQKKFGGFTGAPENYEVTVPDDIKAQLDTSSEEYKAFETFAKDSNMNNDTFNGVINTYLKSTEAKEISPEVIKQHQQDEMAKLGSNGVQVINEVTSWAKNNLADADFDAFRGLADTADNVNLLKKIINKTSVSKVEATAQVTQQFTKEQLREMVGDKRYQEDRSYRLDVDAKYKNYLIAKQSA